MNLFSFVIKNDLCEKKLGLNSTCMLKKEVNCILYESTFSN